MASIREMRLRIKSIKSLAQVTRALETVSASKVRKAVQANQASRSYSEKAWKVLLHLARQPGHNNLHPLLNERLEVRKILVILISGDRGLAGSYNVNVLRNTLMYFDQFSQPVDYICVGKKGRDLLLRKKANVIAEFSELKNPANFIEISPINRLVIDDFLNEGHDQLYLSYTNFHTMTKQETMVRKILPLEVDFSGKGFNATHKNGSSVFTYEPDQKELLDEIIPRFTAMQIYQSVLSSQASEHAARMIAMSNATENANELVGLLQLEYNKARQQSITNDMLDIVGGAAAQTQSGR
ncbi:MAG: F-type H+-transporting ATPase subunit gamma [Chloroflexi bacterium]|nr:MAG: F-type H+-transporting ATPase subunit gamma [Chloroflexota bacterium]